MCAQSTTTICVVVNDDYYVILKKLGLSKISCEAN